MTEILPTKKEGATRELVKDPIFFFTTSWKDLQSKLQKASICEIACLEDGGGVVWYQTLCVCVCVCATLLLSGVPHVSMETVSIRMESLIPFLKRCRTLPLLAPLISISFFHLISLVM